MQDKLCKGCGLIKSLDEFTQSKIGSTNHKASEGQTHHTYCKQCNAERAREWRKKNGTNYKGSGKITAIPPEDRRFMSAIRNRLSTAKGRSKKFNKVEPDLTDTYLYELFLKQNKACALTGVLLNTVKEDPLSLSLDQIDPNKGYVMGNVQWLAWCVNRAKGDLDTQHFYDMCEAVLEYRKVQRLSREGVESSDSKRGTPDLSG